MNKSEQEIKSIQIYNKLLQKWTKDQNSSAYKYPNHYAGAFINAAGNLIVLSTEAENEDIKKELMSISGDNFVIIAKARFKYSELNDVMQDINSYMKENHEVNPIGLKNWGIFDDINKIVVELFDYSEDKIAQFKKNIIDSPCIEFRQALGECVKQTDIQPGQAVYVKLENGSMGFRAKRSGKIGLVTAGHVVQKDNADISLTGSGAIIGTVPAGCYQERGKVDGTFIEITASGYEGSNVTKFGNTTLNLGTSKPIVGETINFEGDTSAKVITGKICSTNFSYDRYSDLSSAKLDEATKGGDSGGIYYDSSKNGVGIHHGLLTHSTQTIFTKIDYINEAFGLERY